MLHKFIAEPNRFYSIIVENCSTKDYAVEAIVSICLEPLFELIQYNRDNGFYIKNCYLELLVERVEDESPLFFIFDLPLESLDLNDIDFITDLCLELHKGNSLSESLSTLREELFEMETTDIESLQLTFKIN